MAEAIGPRQVCRSTCNGCPALKTEDWTEYPDGERDSGTTGTCTAAAKVISAYWHESDRVPEWCPALGVAVVGEAQPTPQECDVANRLLDTLMREAHGTTVWPAHWMAVRDQLIAAIRAAGVTPCGEAQQEKRDA